jgi:alpha/beta hydrolase fold
MNELKLDLIQRLVDVMRVPVALILIVFVSAGSLTAQQASPVTDPKGNYAQVNGLKMYYEIHGSGLSSPPLILLHGAFGFANGWSVVLPTLEKSRKVIVIELQGHGHTADRDEPLADEQLADDTAELLKQLKIKEADFFGYSMGELKTG